MTANQTKPAPAVSAEITDSNGLMLTFAGGDSLFVDPAMFSEAIRLRAMLHGFSAKLVDAAAISRNPDTGRSATVEDKRQAVLAVYERLAGGDWNKGRASGDGVPAGGLLIGALCELYPKQPRAKLVAWVEGLGKEKAGALRLDPKVAAKIAEIKTRKTDAPKVDVAGLLGELEAGIGD